MKPLAYLIAVLTFFIFHSCCLDEHEFTPSKSDLYSSSCFVDREIIKRELDTCNLSRIDTSRICSVELEKTRYLSKSGKSWLPYYCLELNDKLFYTNGERQLLLVSTPLRINHLIENKREEEIENCELGKNILTCGLQEFTYVSVDIVNFSWEINFQVSPVISKTDSTKLSAILNISIPELIGDSPRLGNSTNQFHLIVDNNNSGLPLMDSRHIFHSSIVLNDREFNDVYTYKDNEILDGHIKIYYNKEFGIVAFSDLEGELWVLNK